MSAAERSKAGVGTGRAGVGRRQAWCGSGAQGDGTSVTPATGVTARDVQLGKEGDPGEKRRGEEERRREV